MKKENDMNLVNIGNAAINLELIAYVEQGKSKGALWFDVYFTDSTTMQITETQAQKLFEIINKLNQ